MAPPSDDDMTLDLGRLMQGDDSGHPLDTPMTRQDALVILKGFRDLIMEKVKKAHENQLEQVRQVVVEEIARWEQERGEDDKPWEA